MHMTCEENLISLGITTKAVNTRSNNYVSFIFQSFINRARDLNLGASRKSFTLVDVPQLPLVRETEGGQISQCLWRSLTQVALFLGNLCAALRTCCRMNYWESGRPDLDLRMYVLENLVV